jgi:hypothetical protein
MVAAAPGRLGAERQTDTVRGWRLGGKRRERGRTQGAAVQLMRADGRGVASAQRQGKGKGKGEAEQRSKESTVATCLVSESRPALRVRFSNARDRVSRLRGHWVASLNLGRRGDQVVFPALTRPFISCVWSAPDDGVRTQPAVFLFSISSWRQWLPGDATACNSVPVCSPRLQLPPRATSCTALHHTIPYAYTLPVQVHPLHPLPPTSHRHRIDIATPGAAQPCRLGALSSRRVAAQLAALPLLRAGD